MLSRVLGRILAFVLVYAVVYVAFPLVGEALSVLRAIPSWIYYTCGGLAVLLVVLPAVFTVEDEHKLAAQKQQERDIRNACMAEFEGNFALDPHGAKKAYLRFYAGVKILHLSSAYASSGRLQEEERIRGEVIRVSQLLFGRIYLDDELANTLRRRILDLDRAAAPEALTQLEVQLRKDPTRTVLLYQRLQEAFRQYDAEGALGISEQLFGNDSFLVHDSVVGQMFFQSEQLQKATREVKAGA